ncbi:NAD(P)H-dependent oxidoreductase [Candidatus Methanosphaera massiliense]|jgi:NAD(P)H dehydrogenase (quinone)|uniref:NAD(P)H-dependent oxidoreductase n=1 Tax=Methanosphaera TaxID=2316 RepID=UPI002380807C|nr:NAD(P)H-dependent oxidoreductase [Candidatus Methanosphaera massiliense]MDE4078644.1 NAD(P)H-dependent oxidoreductase [Candidatus Methanosphaera massiliense]MDY2744103.1 NAD(P)H-dependent oxidoreductase [Methanosphaera sp.]
MKTHIIYCHPSNKSLTYQIKEKYIQALTDVGKEYTISDLYAKNFNSDMTEEEYLRESNYTLDTPSSDVLEEQKLLDEADNLTFIFPVFWLDCPSKLVGWFTRVFTYGYRYYSTEGKEQMKTYDNIRFIITMGSGYKDLEADGKISAIKTIFDVDRIKDKARNTQFYIYTSTSHDKITDERKRKILDDVYKIGINSN